MTGLQIFQLISSAKYKQICVKYFKSRIFNISSQNINNNLDYIRIVVQRNAQNFAILEVP